MNEIIEKARELGQMLSECDEYKCVKGRRGLAACRPRLPAAYDGIRNPCVKDWVSVRQKRAQPKRNSKACRKRHRKHLKS